MPSFSRAEFITFILKFPAKRGGGFVLLYKTLLYIILYKCNYINANIKLLIEINKIYIRGSEKTFKSQAKKTNLLLKKIII